MAGQFQEVDVGFAEGLVVAAGFFVYYAEQTGIADRNDHQVLAFECSREFGGIHAQRGAGAHGLFEFFSEWPFEEQVQLRIVEIGFLGQAQLPLPLFAQEQEASASVDHRQGEEHELADDLFNL